MLEILVLICNLQTKDCTIDTARVYYTIQNEGIICKPLAIAQLADLKGNDEYFVVKCKPRR